MVRGGIIAAAQVADALQNAIPFTARFRGTNALCATFYALFIDCLMEWEDIFGGRLDEAEIIKRRHRVMSLRHDADVKNPPNGLPIRKNLLTLAEADAAGACNGRRHSAQFPQYPHARRSQATPRADRREARRRPA